MDCIRRPVFERLREETFVSSSEQATLLWFAGFQGVNDNGDVTTFGRGGSDLSAIALAGALKAKSCQIFTDVEGVFTADPRIVPNACKIPAINYEELLELASSGSKVMQTRAVEFAQKHNIPFEVRSSFTTKPGTEVKKKVKSLEDTLVSGVAIDKNQVRVSVTELPDRPGAAAAVFKVMSESEVVVDMIVQNVARNGKGKLDVHRAYGGCISCRKGLERTSFGRIRGQARAKHEHSQGIRGWCWHAFAFRGRIHLLRSLGQRRHQYAYDQYLGD